jgi:adenine-specific DNA-methyltransferase
MPVSIPKVDLKSQSITKEQKEKLRQLFPEVFSEDTIDFEKLKLTLGADAETVKERFGLTWSGKAECFRIIQEPSIGTLKPAKGESVDWDSTENLFIEGDNLETLKLLQKSYYGKVKMIYIDPPYNTGNEFIYPDKFSETLDTYLSYSGQADADGRKFSTNSETDGRYHSKWLDMMYPRLFLARNLLRDDGVIFISIDDHEVHNLRQIMNEIFGEENFVANIVWQKKQSPQNDAIYISDMHDHILVYVKHSKVNRDDTFGWERQFIPRGDEQDQRYTNPDQDPRGDWTSVDYSCNKTADERPNLFYPIKNPNTGEDVWPSRQRVWRFEKPTHQKNYEEKRIWWGSEGKGFPRLKLFRTEVSEGIVPSTWWKREVAGDNQGARREFRALFGTMEDPFDTPKPVKLIKRIIEISIPNDSEPYVVMDFFAGSCTTAHAVLDTNIERTSKIQYIMVQLPEPLPKEIPLENCTILKNIADVGKERIRRVIDNIKQEQKESAKQKKLADDPETPQDLGFRSFRLAPSNFKVWNGQVPADGKVEKQLEDFIENLHKDGTDEEILYELLLKSGFALTIPITEKKIAGKKVYSIDNDALLICLEHNLTKDLIVKMAEIKPARAICLDAGFKGNDQLRTNALEIMKSHGVTDFRTV